MDWLDSFFKIAESNHGGLLLSWVATYSVFVWAKREQNECMKRDLRTQKECEEHRKYMEIQNTKQKIAIAKLYGVATALSGRRDLAIPDIDEALK